MPNRNPFFTAIEQTLPQHVPLPFQELVQTGQAIQGRYDTNINALDQTATGLASIESRLPAHRQYVSEISNRFKDESSQLLSKYGNRADDPQFARELRQLTNRYAMDPNLRTISMANQLYDQKAKARYELETKGQKYIDSSPMMTGIDENGNLTYDVGSIRATNFDKDLRQQFRDTLDAMINDGRGTITNEQAIANTVRTISEGGLNNPILREGLQYYMSQGASAEEAQNLLEQDIQREAGSALKRSIDYEPTKIAQGWKRISQADERLAFDKAKELAKQNRAQAMIAVSSPLEVKGINESLIKDIDKALKSGSKGFTDVIYDTPENRAKYPNAIPKVERRASTIGALGAPGKTTEINVLEIDDATSKEAYNEFLESAKSEISGILEARGIDLNNDRQVLETYKEYLKADNNAPTFWTTPNPTVSKNLTNAYIGTKGENIGDGYIVTNGKSERVADGKVNLNDYKGFNFTGITTSPVHIDKANLTEGALKGTAVNDKGQIVEIYKPLPPSLEQSLPINILIGKVLADPVSNKTLKDNPKYRLYGRDIVPQKKDGRVSFYALNQDGTLGTMIDTSNEEINEKQIISQYFGIHDNK